MDRNEYLKDLAKRITESEFNDKVYRHFPKELAIEARENSVVIVYGQSDDLMEFDGVLWDEFGCYYGRTFYFDKNGERVEHKTNNKIEAVWCDKDSEWTWTYKTDIPHETFEMYDDDEKYCLGFVFYKDELR